MRMEEFLAQSIMAAATGEDEADETTEEVAAETEEVEAAAPELDVQKAVVEELAVDKAKLEETVNELQQKIQTLKGASDEELKSENERLKGELAAANEKLSAASDEVNGLKIRVAELSSRLAEEQERHFDEQSRNPNALALLDRDVELPDRFPGETRDHVIEAVKEARDRAEAEGRVRRAQLLEGVLVANEPSGNLEKKRAALEKFFNDNGNILSGPVLEELSKYNIAHKNGEEYLLPSEILTRMY